MEAETNRPSAVQRAGRKLRAHWRVFETRLPRWSVTPLYWLRHWASRGNIRLPPFSWRVAANGGPHEVGIVAALDAPFEDPPRRVVYGESEPEPKRPRGNRKTPLVVREYRDVIIMPRRVMVSEAGDILPPSFDLSPQTFFLRPVRGRPDRRRYVFQDGIGLPSRVREPVFLAQASDRGFGHTLMETLPQLSLYPAVPQPARIAIERDAHTPLIEAAGFGQDSLLLIDRPLLCDRVYVGEPPLDLGGNVHPLARTVFAQLRNWATARSSARVSRLFLSRSGIDARRLANEAQVEELFRRNGFKIVRPEILPLADQISLAANADMVAGPAGSAMHLLVFARPSTKALFMCSSGWFSGVDISVAQSDGQFGFVFGEALPHRAGQDKRTRGWTIDPGAVERAMIEHFDL